jgi:surface polysaccharide O-acyltransferase-like enzyme
VAVSTGWGFPAVFYAFWEPLVAWGLIAALLVVAQARFSQPSARWSAWAGQAFGAFIVHTPVLVGLAVLLRGWQAPGLLKFVAVGALATVLSFLLARALRGIPGVRRVL